MTPERRAERILNPSCLILPEDGALYHSGIADAIREAVAAERERAAEIVKRHLMFNDQRAYSWHEAHDVMMAILNGTPSG
jgi:hypothetical protein